MLFNKKGFTLIEVLVVVLIIGILAALAAPNILGRIEQSRITSDKALAKTLENAVASYLVDKDAANEPSSPPEAKEFISKIVTDKYLDASTIDWITKVTKYDADETNDILRINGKSKSIVIVYIHDAVKNTFNIVAYDTAIELGEGETLEYERVP